MDKTSEFASSGIGYDSAEVEAAVVRKIFRRLMWFLVAASCISYLDRINISFAALAMNKQIGLSATAYGLATTIFYLGYVACEIPSNAMLAKFGAQMWISRIMITWGLASAATMFVYNATFLYLMRFLLGVAEAGFTPGVILYMTFWFPRAYRARALSYFILAQAFAMVIGSIISGFILRMPPHFGVESWRWLFLIEGLPATILGILGLFYLTDVPSKARWLNEKEKTALKRIFDREEANAPARAGKGEPLWRQLLSIEPILLGLTYFGLVTTIALNSSWVPLIVKELASKFSISKVAFITAIPPSIAILMLPLWGRSSDRKQERVWHLIVALALAAVGWLLVANASEPEIRLLGLVFCSIGAWCGMSIFWTIPPLFLSDKARATGVALVNSIGLLASAATPSIIGILRDKTGSFYSGFGYATVMLVMSALLILFITWRKRAAVRVS